MIRKKLDFGRLSIRYKLIVHFLLISILPAVALGFFTDWTVNRIIERQVNANTHQLIDKVNKTLESYLNNMQNVTYFIAFHPEIQSFLGQPSDEESSGPYALRKYLQHFTTLYPEIAGIMVVNDQGEYRSNEMYARTERNLTEAWWYREAAANEGIFKIIGSPSERNITSHMNYENDEVVSVVRAVTDPETQEVRGVILIDLKLRVIAETLKDTRLGKTGYLMVMDESGDRIYAPDHYVVDHVRPTWFDEDMSGNRSKMVEGKEIQLIYKKVAFTDWTTVGIFSTNDAVPEVRQIRFYLVTFVFLVCFLGITASYYFSYNITRPIRKLMSYMEKAESGHLVKSADWKNRRDEFGLLMQRFNQMISQIRKLISITERQEKQKREAELSRLQAHIKPHFLYNTMDTIYWMAQKNGAQDISDLVASLSKLFRIGLSKGNTFIALVDEVEHIRSYLSIQQTRYRDKLQYAMDVDPQVKSFRVLKLILQPFVENAIYHGIKERRGPGFIRIRVWQEKQRLLLTVTDDGKGMDASELEALRTRMEQALEADEDKNPLNGGYGVLNVHARLRLTFGENYGVRIDSHRDEGTRVTIIHPVLDHDGRGDENGTEVERIDRG